MNTADIDILETLDVDERIQSLSELIIKNPDDTDSKKSLIELMCSSNIAYLSIRKVLLNADCEYLATDENINDIINSAVCTIMDGDIIKKITIKYNNPLTIKIYLIGIFKNHAYGWIRKVLRETSKRAIVVFTESDDDVFENEVSDMISIEDEFIFENERNNKKLLINSFIQTLLRSHEKPQQLLAIMYVIILAHLTKIQKTVGSINWAFETIGKKNITELVKDSACRLKHKDRPYRWGCSFHRQINEEYTSKNGKTTILKNIVYLDEFSKKDMVNWTSPDRTLKRIRIEWLSGLLADGKAELLYELCDVKEAQEALNHLMGVER